VGAVTAAALNLAPTVLYADAGNQTCSPEQEAANIKLVEMINTNPAALEQALHPDYIQHNAEMVRFAELNGLTLKQATEQIGKLIRQGPPPVAPSANQPRSDFSYKLIADCDMIVAVGQHWHPYPDNPSKFYATYFFNMWRIKDGKLYEHWDPKDLPTPLPDFLKAPLKDLKPAGAPAKADERK
jgi:hypothetical protein